LGGSVQQAATRLLVFRDLPPAAVHQEAGALGHELGAPASCTTLLRVLHPTAEQRRALAGAHPGFQSFETRPPAVPGIALYGPAEALRQGLLPLGLDPAPPPAAAHPLLPHGRSALLGILNVTPDSFSDGGLYARSEAALEHALEMAAQGADLLDVGAESTRPGAPELPAGDELRRLLPVLERLRDKCPLPLSVDTRKPEVARRALEMGCAIVNDVGGLRQRAMAEVAAEHGATVICMHMAGEPATMQDAPHYDDLFGEIALFLAAAAERAAEAGIPPERVWLDPGIGFGKTFSHNLRLLRGLSAFASLGRPLLVGASRKRFLGPLSGRAADAAVAPPPRGRLVPSVVAALEAARRGAAVLRVHDVAETRQALQTLAAIESAHIVQPPRGERS
jgi:dihydropteroate synthase